MTAPSTPSTPSASSAPSAPSGSLLDGLQRALSYEHVAVFAYSELGVKLLDANQVGYARSRQASHREQRDSLQANVSAIRGTPVAPMATYSPAERVVDPVTAQRWALEVETGCAAGYRYLLETTAVVAAATARRTALSQLTLAAVSAAHWRALLTPPTPSVPFPGA